MNARQLWLSVIGWLLALATGSVFALATRASGEWNTGLEWERRLLLSMQTTLPGAIDTSLLIVPWFGTNITLLPLVLIAAVYLVRRARRPDIALHLIVVELGALGLTLGMKALFDRPRPALWEHRGQFAHTAFPSGHAIASIAVLFTAAYLAHRELGWRWPYLLAATLLLISFYSRLYLGVHWPTDVLGGAIVGLVWLGATLFAFRRRTD